MIQSLMSDGRWAGFTACYFLPQRAQRDFHEGHEEIPQNN